ncbi:immunity 22 family protein [uncultured Winogradskyella sp.]|uniref:immunity 22 family protein n=1 Tax=uncultured Winogradskyella sp. TaxID=395353 RepID=UPI0026170F7F|nr:immunity 22 family protein [uncultured Winogradskyella sp.]
MEEYGKVSIWVGNFKGANEFGGYMEEVFDKEGDSTSKFMIDFKIDYIDIQFQEVDFNNQKMSLEDKLEGCSYLDTFSDQIPIISEHYNSVVCLYNFKYSGLIKECSNLKYIGYFNYKED